MLGVDEDEDEEVVGVEVDMVRWSGGVEGTWLFAFGRAR